ncbi:MAG: ribonuclease E/G [Elusimicrobia bacterium]|nr:ribonuclease E/G [Elusimicrobiota bacterium]
MRLRNISGIIVIDFVDMRRKRNQIKVVKCWKGHEAPVPNQILPITRLGLVEMTRDAVRNPFVPFVGALRRLRVRATSSRESIATCGCKEIHELTQGRTEGRLEVTLAPRRQDFVRGQQDRLKKSSGRVKSTIDRTLAWEDYRIVFGIAVLSPSGDAFH